MSSVRPVLLHAPRIRSLVVKRPSRSTSISRSRRVVVAATAVESDYASQGALGLAEARIGWLGLFCAGLLLEAGVVKDFDALIASHVELSYLLPLVMGHAGNVSSQTTCAIVRGLALDQISPESDCLQTTAKECGCGCVVGAVIGAVIYATSLASGAISEEVAHTTAVAMPVVSVWASTVGAAVTFACARLRLDPVMISAPLAATIVDATSVILYFCVASRLLSVSK